MARGLYESLNHGFDNMIKSALKESKLDEKKQEISPEDKRDNDLIRSAMKKRITRSNASLSKEEKDALSRNGWKADGRRFNTANGYVNIDEYGRARIQNYSQETDNSDNNNRAILKSRNRDYRTTITNPDGTTRSVWKTKTIEPNVNFVDMGRKQPQRAENSKYGDYSISGVTRKNPINREQPSRIIQGNTSHYELGDPINKDSYSANQNIQNKYNRLAKERICAQNLIKGKDAVDRQKSYRNNINHTARSMEWDDDYRERERAEYLGKIAHYKKLLADLESRYSKYDRKHSSDIDNYREKMKQNLEQRRAEFNARKTKTESFKNIHRRKIAESRNTSKGKRV